MFRSSTLAILALAACATHPPALPSAPNDAGASSSAAPRYLALGDSFTIGTGSTPEQSFPARLSSRWSCAVALENAGVNGYTTQNLIDAELPRLADFKPTFVTLAIGANDIVHGSTPDAYRAQVHRILAAVVAAGVARIVAVPQPDWSLSPVAASFGTPAQLGAQIIAFNAILRDETVAVSGVYVDLFPLMESEAKAGMLAGDGLHPSSAAYDAWAAQMSAQLPDPCK